MCVKSKAEKRDRGVESFLITSEHGVKKREREREIVELLLLAEVAANLWVKHRK